LFFAARDLINDIRQFLALIPQDEVKALFESQYSSDAAFASSVDFIRSPRFGELVGLVDGVAEFKAVSVIGHYNLIIHSEK
jgi:Insect allergen related repeat, nitrile-specifier detoxification